MAYTSRVTLPARHHAEDTKWLKSQLMILNPTHQIRARLAYSDIYSKTYTDEPIAHKKLNRARNKANERMRKFVFACSSEYVSSVNPMQSTMSAHQSNFDIGDL